MNPTAPCVLSLNVYLALLTKKDMISGINPKDVGQPPPPSILDKTAEGPQIVWRDDDGTVIGTETEYPNCLLQS